jgi:hypothetical protein
MSSDFPALGPPPHSLISWPAPVTSGYQLVASKYETYCAALQLDDGNLGRLRTFYHSIVTDLLLLWLSLDNSGLSRHVSDSGLDCLACLYVCLGESVELLQE